MKKVFIWSVPHTGTFFCSKTISYSHPNSHYREGSIGERLKNRGFKDKHKIKHFDMSNYCQKVSVITEEWYNHHILHSFDEEEYADKDLVIAHFHFMESNSWMIKSITENKPEVSIIVPMRDPILSLHSFMWRGIEFYGNNESTATEPRKRRCIEWIERYKKLLFIPKSHVFVLPIDNQDAQDEEKRIEKIKELATFCDVSFTKEMNQAAIDWEPENNTKRLIEVEAEKTPAPRWENFKEKYHEGDLKHTKAIMGPEYEILNSDKELQKMLYDIGYRDLLWWR